MRGRGREGLKTSGGNGGHPFGFTDQGFGRVKVEEVDRLKFVVFGRFEDVEGDAGGLAGGFVDGVEEVEEKLLSQG